MRQLLYIVAGIPIGFAILVSLRLGVGQQDTIVESAYIVNAVVFTGAVAATYTFVEQAAEDIKKRETQLQRQIEDLRIEIDEMKRDRQVAEITETEYFQDLRAQAEELKKKRRQKHQERW
jgi:TolA-binding protein